jgi:hypothetical protein
VTTHENSALPAVTCLDGLPRIELGRPAWYRGHIAEVRRLSMHRLLLLREVARDGSALALWASSVALGGGRSTSWAALLDARPLPSLAVRFRGRFPCCSAIDPLTADIHFPEDIGVCRGIQPCVSKISAVACSRCR